MTDHGYSAVVFFRIHSVRNTADGCEKHGKSIQFRFRKVDSRSKNIIGVLQENRVGCGKTGNLCSRHRMPAAKLCRELEGICFFHDGGLSGTDVRQNRFFG